MILSTFSCACWLSVYLFWRNVYLDLLPIFWIGLFGFLILSCMNCLYILHINPLLVAGIHSLCNVFLWHLVFIHQRAICFSVILLCACAYMGGSVLAGMGRAGNLCFIFFLDHCYGLINICVSPAPPPTHPYVESLMPRC